MSITPHIQRALLVLLPLFLLFLASSCAPTVDLEAEKQSLLAIHERILQAHRAGDVNDWLDAEAEEYISVNRGRISFPTSAERRAGREPYLEATTFTVYRDLSDPIVRISVDGTMGWVVAEVEVQGNQVAEDGVETEINVIWAWVELYEKVDGAWKVVGNVSNRRP